MGQMGRLDVIFGTPKGRTPDMVDIMAREWLESLKHFPRWALTMAVGQAINTCKFWPVPAEIRELCLAALREDRELREANQARLPPSRPVSKSPEERSRADEIFRIRAKHKDSATPFSDTINDPEYQALLGDFQRRTGWQPK